MLQKIAQSIGVPLRTVKAIFRDINEIWPVKLKLYSCLELHTEYY